MPVTIDLRPVDRLRCASCGESMDAQGNDPWELLFSSHYCPTDANAS
jgi:hypothetical protein